ncbi:MAG: sporulation transcriptional regulator SpoIIID [Clostridia bacterium]|nr:sporulation transcriptional regulator SpoIIID [Clostridia bacterium]
MKQSLSQRTLSIAHYVIEHRATVRQAARIFGLGKSTVHADLTRRLPKLDAALFAEVKQLLSLHLQERHLAGGEATRRKYAALRSPD